MRLGRVAVCLLLGLLLLFMPPLPLRDAVNGDRPAPPSGRKQPVISEDERQLQKDVQAGDADAVLAFFRKRTPSAEEAARLRSLIAQLGDRSFAERDRAQAELLSSGRAAVGLLLRARRDADPEVAARSRRCLEAFEGDGLPDLVPSAARLVAQARPDGATAALLGYVPFAEDEAASEAVLAALSAVAVRDGRVDQAVTDALTDAEPLRRAAAAQAMLRAGIADAPARGRTLLSDPAAEVRLRVARALLEAKDRAAVPVLIDLLAELTDERGDDVEETLTRLAGPRTPAAPRGTDAESCRRRRDAWVAWWRDHADAVDLSRVPPPQAVEGATLVLQMSLEPPYEGSLEEVDREGTPRRRLRGLEYPVGVQALPDGVLVAEYQSGLVTERNRKGEVVWKYQAAGPVVAARRLADGETFLALRNRLVVVDKLGKELVNLSLGPRDVAAARRAPDGRFVVVTLHGVCRHLDAEGKEVRRFPVGTAVLGAGIDLLPTRRVLVPEFAAGRVAEYDPDGRLSWQAAVEKPTSAVRLANGHTLVGSTTTRQVVELDRDGKVVWQHRADEAVTGVAGR